MAQVIAYIAIALFILFIVAIIGGYLVVGVLWVYFNLKAFIEGVIAHVPRRRPSNEISTFYNQVLFCENPRCEQRFSRRYQLIEKGMSGVWIRDVVNFETGNTRSEFTHFKEIQGDHFRLECESAEASYDGFDGYVDYLVCPHCSNPDIVEYEEFDWMKKTQEFPYKKVGQINKDMRLFYENKQSLSDEIDALEIMVKEKESIEVFLKYYKLDEAVHTLDGKDNLKNELEQSFTEREKSLNSITSEIQKQLTILKNNIPHTDLQERLMEFQKRLSENAGNILRN